MLTGNSTSEPRDSDDATRSLPEIEHRGDVPPRKSGMAVAAAAFSIVGFVVCPIAVGIALILAIVALRRIRARPTEYGGRGLAMAALCIVGVYAIAAPIVYLRFRELARRFVDAQNLKGVGNGWHIYQSGEALGAPPDFDAMIAAGMLTAGDLHDPSESGIHHCDYFFVSELHFRGSEAAPAEQTPLRWPVAWCDPAYHNNEGGVVLFVTGQVEFCKQPEFDATIADFKREYEATFGQPPKIIRPK